MSPHWPYRKGSYTTLTGARVDTWQKRKDCRQKGNEAAQEKMKQCGDWEAAAGHKAEGDCLEEHGLDRSWADQPIPDPRYRRSPLLGPGVAPGAVPVTP